jgi:alpha/beta superfamily hydrolase
MWTNGSKGEPPLFFPSTERPLFFPSAGRPLYGAFHPSETGQAARPVLVICHTVGLEHMVTQRMEVLVARAAAKAGFPAFRYNARGHGDSAGNSREVTLPNLVDDASAAGDIAREISGATSIIWLGFRFGSLVAAETIRRRDDAVALALCEPIHRVHDYFRAVMRGFVISQITRGNRVGLSMKDFLEKLEREGELPVISTYFYRALYRSALGVELAGSLEHWNGKTLIMQVQNKPKLSLDNERLRSAIEDRAGAKVSVALITKEPAWHMHPAIIPQWSNNALLEATTEWLHGLG